MTKKTARKGDPTDHGGEIKTGSSTRKVNGKEVARKDDIVSCPIHGDNPIVGDVSSTISVDGKALAWVGSVTACGSKIIDGSSDVLSGNKTGAGSITVIYENKTIVYDAPDVIHSQQDDEESDPGDPIPGFEAPSTPPAEEITEDQPPATPVSTDCNGIQTSSDQFRLSPNFTLGNLSSGVALTKHPVRAQHGLTKAQIICNLRALAVNCLEPLAARYGRQNMIITSAFRRSKPSGSQHELGEALDLQFVGISDDEYWSRALWVRDNISYDQFILEYIGNRPWFHLSYREGRLRRKVNTCPAPGQYPSGLKKYR